MEINIFDLASVDKAIEELEKLNERLAKCEKELVPRLLAIGQETAQPIFNDAPIATDADPHVDVWTESDGNTGVLHAAGEVAGFLEFGTGIIMGQGETLPRPEGWGLGEYGRGRGKNPPWGYYGSAGDNLPEGTREVLKKGKTVTITKGNKPAGAMLRASEEMQDNAAIIAREVLNKS